MWHVYIQEVAWAGLEHLLINCDPDDLDYQDWVWDMMIEQYHKACNFTF